MNANSASKDGIDLSYEQCKDHLNIKMINENLLF